MTVVAVTQRMRLDMELVEARLGGRKGRYAVCLHSGEPYAASDDKAEAMRAVTAMNWLYPNCRSHLHDRGRKGAIK